MSSLPTVVAALGAAVFGGGMLFSSAKTNDYFTNTHIHHQEEDAFIRHTRDVAESASPYEGLNRFRNWVVDPAQYQVIQRNYLKAKSYGKLMWDNILPIGLASTAVVYGLGGSMSGVLGAVGRGLGPAGRGIQYLGGMFGRAGWNTIVNGGSYTIRSIASLMDPARLTVRSSMFGAALTGLGIYGAAKLKGEFDKTNQENTFGHFISPNPGEH